MRFRIAVVSAVVIGSVSIPQAADAQQCGRIYDLECEEELTHSHRFAPDAVLEDAHPTPESFHSECLQCQVWTGEEWIGVDWGECHGDCPNQEEEQLYSEAMLALRQGDLARAVQIGKDLPSRFAINAERRALQVTDCRGEVIASVPLGAMYEQAKESFDASAQSGAGVLPEHERLDSPYGWFLAGLLITVPAVSLLRRRT
jgi:hypothetical protein